MSDPDRRFLLTRLPAGVAFALAAPVVLRAGPARAAGCGTLLPMRGIGFTRQDGTEGVVVPQEDGTVLFDYVMNRGKRLDQRRGLWGIFEVWQRLNAKNERPERGTPDFNRTFSPAPVEPLPGGTWSGTVKEVETRTFNDENFKLKTETAVTEWRADYSYGAAEVATIDGCWHRVFPAEARYVSDAGSFTRSWTFFADLGYGIETGQDGVANPVIGMLSG